MINIGHDKVGRFFIGSTANKAISIGSLHNGDTASAVTKIWEAISSCFGSGKWRPQKPWRGKDKWKYELIYFKYGRQDNHAYT